MNPIAWIRERLDLRARLAAVELENSWLHIAAKLNTAAVKDARDAAGIAKLNADVNLEAYEEEKRKREHVEKTLLTERDSHCQAQADLRQRYSDAEKERDAARRGHKEALALHEQMTETVSDLRDALARGDRHYRQAQADLCRAEKKRLAALAERDEAVAERDVAVEELTKARALSGDSVVAGLRVELAEAVAQVDILGGQVRDLTNEQSRRTMALAKLACVKDPRAGWSGVFGEVERSFRVARDLVLERDDLLKVVTDIANEVNLPDGEPPESILDALKLSKEVEPGKVRRQALELGRLQAAVKRIRKDRDDWKARWEEVHKTRHEDTAAALSERTANLQQVIDEKDEHIRRMRERGQEAAEDYQRRWNGYEKQVASLRRTITNMQLRHDRFVYGTSFESKEGTRIDPTRIVLDTENGTFEAMRETPAPKGPPPFEVPIPEDADMDAFWKAFEKPETT